MIVPATLFIIPKKHGKSIDFGKITKNFPYMEQIVPIKRRLADGIHHYQKVNLLIATVSSFVPCIQQRHICNAVLNSDTDNSSIKEFLDSHESFINEYVDFLKKYNNSSDTTGMLSDYMDIMKRYAEFAEKANNLDKDEMSPADAAYCLKVITRCANKLDDYINIKF